MTTTNNKRAAARQGEDTGQRSLSLRAALEAASEHWAARPGEKVMATMAGKCVEALEEAGWEKAHVDRLEKRHAIKLLSSLRLRGLKPKTVAAYYGAFRRMLALNGVDTVTWPKAPTPPRKTRDPLSRADAFKIIEWLEMKGWQATADIGRILMGTGLRVNVEALSRSNLTLTRGDKYDVLHVIGKGGHERLIPVVSEEARAVLRSDERMAALHDVTYSGHIQRWRKAVAFCGVHSRLATPHAMRHGYATEALANSGGNLAMVQELLGHADPGTTARYLSVDLSAKAKALAKPGDTPECATSSETS